MAVFGRRIVSADAVGAPVRRVPAIKVRAESPAIIFFTFPPCSSQVREDLGSHPWLYGYHRRYVMNLCALKDY
jgi:hypothetical protein